MQPTNMTQRHRNAISLTPCWLFLGTWLVLTFMPFSTARCQQDQLPRQGYYNNFIPFYEGDYRRAERQFSSDARSAFKFGNTRFLDSLCYWTMLGECHYHMGNYGQAMNFYNEALALYLQFNDKSWQSRVQLPPTIQVATNLAPKARITWGTPKRTAKYSDLPNTMSYLFGNLNSGQALQQGGVVDPARQRRVDVQEIARCVALAMHRRRIIMGPTCQYDPLTQQLSSKLSAAGTRGSVFGCWNGVIMGVAKSASADTRTATKLLARSLQFSGGIDHWLTPIALLELAHLAKESNELAAAHEFALEASYCAAVFNQYDLVEEALSFATAIHLSSKRTPYPALEPAIAWANRNRARLMQATMIVRLAECYAEAGDAASSGRILGQFRRATSRTSLNQAVVGSRATYVAAVNQFLTGKFNAGAELLADALKQFQNGSLWLYRLRLADQLAIEGSITPRQSDALYELLLHDPTVEEWRFDPMEAVAFLASSHVGALERWFEIKIRQRNAEQALTVADLVRRHRFFATLPMGGRLLAFRWILESPQKAISDFSFKQRKDFLIRVPGYKQLVDQATTVRNKLIRIPLKPDPDSDEAREQARLYAELAKISDAQESLLASFALRREPTELAFPPSIDVSKFRDKIGKDQIAVVCMATEAGYHFFLVGNEGERYLGIRLPNKIRSGMSKLFKELGIRDHSGSIDEAKLREEDWKQLAFDLGKAIFGDTTTEEWQKYKEVVIIPDGAMWYLPFELIRVGSDFENSQSIGELVETRYSPTLGLAFGAQRPVRQLQRSIVVTGRMHPKLDQSQTLKAFEKIQPDFPTAVSIDSRIKIGMNFMGSIADQLVVLTDMKLPRGGIYAMSPAQADDGPGSSLASWLSLPWSGPEHIVLPGFTSAGAGGPKSRATGNELFTTTCALMGSGVRTVLITRWRAGGDSSLDLVREYMKGLKDGKTAAQSIREAIEIIKQAELNAEMEPRWKLGRKKPEDPAPDKLKAEHPLFWAGPMVMEVPTQNSASLPPVADPNAKPDADPTAADPDSSDANDDDQKGEKDDKDDGEMKEEETDKTESTDPSSSNKSDKNTETKTKTEKKKEEGSGSQNGSKKID